MLKCNLCSKALVFTNHGPSELDHKKFPDLWEKNGKKMPGQFEFFIFWQPQMKISNKAQAGSIMDSPIKVIIDREE